MSNPIKPVSCKGRYLRRSGNANHQLTINEISDLYLKTFKTSWDYYPDPNHHMDAISLDKVLKFIETANKIRPFPIDDDPLTVLKKFELVKEETISNGCHLLFRQTDTPDGNIEAGRFADEIHISDAVTIRTDLISEIKLLQEFIYKHINRAYIISGAAQRIERWDYPLDALREIIINMVVHRDYQHPGDSIVKIFDDRIEFFNPGSLLKGLTVAKLLSGDYSSQVRNPQISTIFKEAGLIEKYGSGIKRILADCREHGLPDPIFEEIQHGFRVTAFGSTQKTTQKTRDIILELLKEDPRLTREQLAINIDKSPNTIKGHLARLKAEGRLKRIGNDRDGYWEVVEGN